MCVNDWRLGRYIKSATRTINPTSAAPVTLTANPQRVGIGFAVGNGASFAGKYIIVTSGGVAVYTLTEFLPGRTFTLANDGDLPTKELVVTNSSGVAATVGVIEYFLPEEILSGGERSWKP